MELDKTIKVVKMSGVFLTSVINAAGTFSGSPNVVLFSALGTAAFAFTGEIAELITSPKRQKKASEAVLRYLTKQAFKSPTNHNQQVPVNVPMYRATVLWPERVPKYKLWLDPLLRPVLRAELGTEVRDARSSVSFPRGVPYAGMAWDKPETIYMHDDLPSLADCGNDLSAWQAAWINKRIPIDVVKNLGKGADSQNGFVYMHHTRSILCIGFKLDGGIIVISIDSVLKHGFEKPIFQTEPADLIAAIKFLIDETK